jgi:hypothetical protein
MVHCWEIHLILLSKAVLPIAEAAESRASRASRARGSSPTLVTTEGDAAVAFY